MKLTDKIVSRYGQDKVLHFLVGAWIVAQFDDYGIIIGLLSLVPVGVLAYAKERLDAKADNGDIIASVVGGVCELVLFAVRSLIL